MKLEELQQNGGLVSEKLTKKTATWNGDEVSFFVRLLSFGAIDKIYNGNDPDASQAAELIAQAVRLGDEGEESLTRRQAFDLTPSLATLFADAVMKVNGVNDEGAGDPLGSPPKTSSGSNSQPSSAARSRKSASA